MPPNYVCRQQLLDEMVTKLCQSTIDHNSYGTSLTVTGAGGFGKTSIVTALCHHPVIKEHFTDGVVFIELGPQATDPTMKLKGLYYLLTNQQCDVNVVEQKINQLTSDHCRNLLVIIDDVWLVEDAELIVKAFSHCKIILTSRKNDIDQYIPTKQIVSIGPMEQSEALSLLTCGVVDVSQLSQEDVNLLDELAQDVHLWPLLLSLVKGQLSHNLKRHKLSHHQAIQNVVAKLHDNGITAFDKNDIERSRKYAVKACIEVTLGLLTKSQSDKIKTLILWTGIGASLQTAVLHYLWKVTEHEAIDAVDLLWSYGLVQFTDVTIPPHSNTQHCVEVHAVISHYIMQNMNNDEVYDLSPVAGFDTYQAVSDGFTEQFRWFYAVSDPSTPSGFLEFRQNVIENFLILYYIKQINMLVITEPNAIIGIMQKIQQLTISTNIAMFLPTLRGQIDSVISNCRKTLKHAHKISRRLKQSVERCLAQKNYHLLIQTIENYNCSNSVGVIAQQAAAITRKITPCINMAFIQQIVNWQCEQLQIMTPDYSFIALLTLPHIKFYIKELQLVNTALQAGSHDISLAYNYYTSGKCEEDYAKIRSDWLNKLREIAPNYVQQMISQHGP